MKFVSSMVSLRLIATLVTIAAISTLVAGGSFAASPRERLKAKTAEARQVLGEVNALDQRFEASVEAWHGAQFQLDRSRRQLAVDRANLRFAKHQQRVAITQIDARLVAIYKSGDDSSGISILFGSTSLSDLIARLDAAQAVAASDRRLAANVAVARARFALAEREAVATMRRRAAAVTRRASERRRIGSLLAERQRLLASVQSEVAALKAQEARRQAVLAAQARERLAREEAALQRQQVRRAQAAAAARAAKSATPTPTAPPPASQPAPSTTTVALETTPKAPAAPAPPPGAEASGGGHPEAATIAMKYLGVPYVWGGSSPAGFDCSGLVLYVFAQLGVSLPHFAAAQYTYGVPVSRDQLQPGDLVFFDGLNHVGIYIGGGEVIHAPHTGDVVKISPLSEFGAGYVGARRI